MLPVRAGVHMVAVLMILKHFACSCSIDVERFGCSMHLRCDDWLVVVLVFESCVRWCWRFARRGWPYHRKGTKQDCVTSNSTDVTLNSAARYHTDVTLKSAAPTLHWTAPRCIIIARLSIAYQIGKQIRSASHTSESISTGRNRLTFYVVLPVAATNTVYID